MMRLFSVFFILISCGSLRAQIDESATGAWYMYFYKLSFDESQWGLQGDFQYRDWQGLGDREQLLIRNGITYKPEDSDWMFTLGYANITSGPPGAGDAVTTENRIYQEALFPHVLGERFLFSHRFRYEQRFVEDQDFRTRYRYSLGLNIPLNNTSLEEDTIYLAMYDELFINGQRNIGNGKSVDWFDRNRLYFGLGYVLSPESRVQFGWMNQTTDGAEKGQLQFSLYQSF
jgi:Protein of unknown function (DUF2490)